MFAHAIRIIMHKLRSQSRPQTLSSYTRSENETKSRRWHDACPSSSVPSSMSTGTETESLPARLKVPQSSGHVQALGIMGKQLSIMGNIFRIKEIAQQSIGHEKSIVYPSLLYMARIINYCRHVYISSNTNRLKKQFLATS